MKDRKAKASVSRADFQDGSFVLAFQQSLIDGLGSPFTLGAGFDPLKGLYPELLVDRYTDAQSFADDYLVTELLSKYPFKVPGVDRVANAMSKFRDAEQQCSLTNLTVETNTWFDHPFLGRFSWHAVIETARRKVLRLLGPLNLDSVEAHCCVGPGASTSLSRVRADAFYKFGCKPDVTPDLALYAWCLVNRQPAWWLTLTGELPSGIWVEDFSKFPPEKIFNYVPGNRVTTVPKNAKTDRVIAIEPDLNMYVQKGLGSVMRKRLRRAGINLNDQTINQRLAQLGSRDGSLATIDFSSASDTICLRIVEALLPPDWFSVLKLARSPVGVLPDSEEVITYSKFSSMGNGFTFELESLIFWALSSACLDLVGVEGLVSVYGDDLIVPTNPGLDDALLWVFSRAGFTINREKTFFRGPFRESCGKHFFMGDDVTPFYIRTEIKTVWDLYKIANRLRAWARHSTWGLDSRCLTSYQMIVEAIPKSLRVYIPDGIGDVGLVGEFDEACPKFNRQLQMLSVKRLLPVTKHKLVKGNSLITKWFHQRGELPNSDSSVEALPRTMFDYGEWKMSLVRQWPSYGSWV